MKTGTDLSLYEVICIIIFFRLPNSGLYLFIRQELYLYGGRSYALAVSTI